MTTKKKTYIPILEKLLSIGHVDRLSMTDEHKLRLTNMMAVIGLLFAPFYISLTFFEGTVPILLSNIMAIAMLSVPLVANKLHRYVFARYWVCIVFPILIVTTCYKVGIEMNLDLILILLAILPLPLFDKPKEYAPLVFFTMSLWAGCNLILPELEPVVDIYVPAIVHANELLVFLGTIVLFWQFKHQLAFNSDQLQVANKRLEEQILKVNESEQRFRVMAENIPSGSITLFSKDLFILDAAGEEVKANQELSDAQLGRNIKDILGDSDFEQRRHYYEKALGGEKAVFESKFKNEYYINSISPLYTNGEIETLIMSSQKVTDVKRYQKELDAQKKLIQNIFDNAPLLISVISQEGRYVTVNKEYERLFGIETAEIIGKHYSELLQSTIQQFDEVGANLEKTLKDGKLSYTYDLYSPVTGETISLFTIYTKLYLDTKPAVMIMGMNVSAQKVAENKLRSSYKQLDTQNRMIQDSINYALRIQHGVLDSSIAFLESYENNFVFSKPKDVLSGDFYWAAELDNNKRLIIAADATGHGVPGAMLTLIGTDYLNEIIYSYHIHKPDILLQELDRKITDMLTKDGSSSIQDGMDMSVVLIDCKNGKFEFASAKSPIYTVNASDMKLTKHKGSRHSIGGKRNKHKKNFSSEVVPFENGDMLYLGSDGFSDQFGGQEHKKLGKKRMQDLMKTVAHQTIEEQKCAFENYFAAWKGDQQQIDDVLIMGIRLIEPAEQVAPKESTLASTQEKRDHD